MEDILVKIKKKSKDNQTERKKPKMQMQWLWPQRLSNGSKRAKALHKCKSHTPQGVIQYAAESTSVSVNHCIVNVSRFVGEPNQGAQTRPDRLE